MPAKRSTDPWITGADRVGEYVRNELVAEVIGFANAYGGDLVVGIEETNVTPA